MSLVKMGSCWTKPGLSPVRGTVTQSHVGPQRHRHTGQGLKETEAEIRGTLLQAKKAKDVWQPQKLEDARRDRFPESSNGA